MIGSEVLTHVVGDALEEELLLELLVVVVVVEVFFAVGPALALPRSALIRKVSLS